MSSRSLAPDWDAPAGARQLTRDYGDAAARDRDIAAMGREGWHVQSLTSQPSQIDGRRLALVVIVGLFAMLIASQLATFLVLFALALTVVAAIVIPRRPARTLVLYERDDD